MIGRWIVRLYNMDGEVASEADFGTKAEAETCRDEIEALAVEAGGWVEMKGPETTSG